MLAAGQDLPHAELDRRAHHFLEGLGVSVLNGMAARNQLCSTLASCCAGVMPLHKTLRILWNVQPHPHRYISIHADHLLKNKRTVRPARPSKQPS